MHITDYGLWFYCIEEGMSFDKPQEFVKYMLATYGKEELQIIAEKNVIDGTPGFITRSCDVCYNGSDIDTSLKLRYVPKIGALTLETSRAKRILDSECYGFISELFNIMQVQKQQNRLGQALILNYRQPPSFQRESLTTEVAR